MEKLIKQYLESFFTIDEKFIVKKAYNISNYKISEVSEWLDAETRFKQLLPYTDLNNFYIEIAESCSFFIKKLFENSITNDTFIISTTEHVTIQQCLSNITNKFILQYNTIKNFDINTILNQYEQSGCKRIVLYFTGIVETHVLPLEFCYKLKNILIDKGIEHIIILDDVQSMFLIPKDYTIFDYVLFTCHSLLPNFDSGILLSKTYENLGYQDAAVLNEYLYGLKIVLNKLDKLNLFNLLLQQYYAEELANEDLFDIPKNCIQNNFYLQLKTDLSYNILNKYSNELEVYGIRLGGNILMIRGINFIIQDPTKAMEGLNRLKSILQKCIKLKNKAI